MNPTSSDPPRSIRGRLLQAVSATEIESGDVVITLDDTGRIETIREASEHEGDVDVRLEDHQRLLPGLVDLHIHAPQWPQLGTGLDLPLETWLFEYTFPLEARFVDPDFARSVWDHMVPSLLRHGTTTAVYYGSIHEPATSALAETCARLGQRAFVGRVAMDHHEGTPEWYRDASAGEAVAASARSIEAIHRLGTDLVQPIITPRFVPACSDAALTGLGELAHDAGVLVQTHCSEGDWEHGHVLERLGVTDTAALDGFGLLRPHTVLAHGGLLTDSDFDTIAQRRAGVAHCPLSNSYFGDAVFPLRKAMARGVSVGLGTDIAGGPEPSLMRTASQAITSSRMLESGVDPSLERNERGVPGARVDATTALWLATGGGAEVLGLDVGRLDVGRPFDAVVVDVDGPGAAHWPDLDDDARLVEKIVRSTSADRIAQTWVDGRLVSTRPE